MKKLEIACPAMTEDWHSMKELLIFYLLLHYTKDLEYHPTGHVLKV